MEQEVPLPSVVQQLVDMGFDVEKSKLAYQQAKNSEDIAQVIEYIQNNDEKLEEQLKSGVKADLSQKQESGSQQEGQQEESKEDDDQQLKPISDMVDQNLSKQLQEMGHSRIVAEKALFMTQNKKTIEAALDYIEEHKEDEDFNEELFISGAIQKSNLTPEEAKIKAREMAAAMREKREKMEEEADLQREKNRLKNDKLMRDTQEKMKEIQKAREVQQQVEERQKFQDDKKKMQDRLDQDYIERFGMEKFKIWKAKQQGEKKELTPIEKSEQGIKALVTAHPQQVFPDKAMTALSTLKKYLEAVIKNPQEEKFRKINSQNAGYKKRVGDAFSGQAILESCGFVLDFNGFLICDYPNIQHITAVVGLLDTYMKKI